MRKWRIQYSTTITDDELRDFMDDQKTDIEELLNSYLWKEMRPEGDEWDVEELMYPYGEP